MRKIAVFTGTRAEYGLLYWVIKGLDQDDSVELQLYVGGMHLSPEFGSTVDQIEKDGFVIYKKLEFLLSSDSACGIAKSMGLALIAAADAFQEDKPDILVVLGDRFEAMPLCQAAMVYCIPIAHIHGGETTEGLIDEAIRHSITKMAHLHFASTATYKNRIIQLGENPENVFEVGAPGIDSIKSLALLSKNELSEFLDFDVNKPFFLATYHPVTLEINGAIEAFDKMLSAITEFNDYNLVITYPNSDTHGRELIEMLDQYQSENKQRVLVSASLGQLKYLSMLKHAQLVIGNSSSALIEAPSFNIPTVNIGIRQLGRVSGKTVINCDETKKSITNAIKKALSSEFLEQCKSAKNPYGEGGSSEKILDKIISEPLDNLVNKKFYDIAL